MTLIEAPAHQRYPVQRYGDQYFRSFQGFISVIYTGPKQLAELDKFRGINISFYRLDQSIQWLPVFEWCYAASKRGRIVLTVWADIVSLQRCSTVTALVGQMW